MYTHVLSLIFKNINVEDVEMKILEASISQNGLMRDERRRKRKKHWQQQTKRQIAKETRHVRFHEINMLVLSEDLKKKLDSIELMRIGSAINAHFLLHSKRAKTLTVLGLKRSSRAQ